MTQNAFSKSTSVTLLTVIIALNASICIGLVLGFIAGVSTLQLYLLTAGELAAVLLVYYRNNRKSMKLEA